jgi:UDP-2,3-diacylglucosamine pyrophosphatase LpxH
VIYLPGNHDSSFTNYNNNAVAGIEVCEEYIHHTMDNKKYLVLHGDQFGCVVQKSTWLAGVGSVLYEYLLGFNRFYNKIRKWQEGSVLEKKFHSVAPIIPNSQNMYGCAGPYP